ncbi:MAG: carbon monoxide dehydrogenase subunit G [Hansschlegelia sp.]
MEISGSHRIPASREAVWAALEDVEVLRACIPGCTRLEKRSNDVFDGAGTAKIGPITAEFTGGVTRETAAAPARITLAAHGAAGPAGSARGRAELDLAADDDGGTVVAWTAAAELEGKIAQLGSRLVTGFARHTADGFFLKLAELAAAGRLPTPLMSEAPPLVYEEPSDAPAAVVDAPPLAAGGPQPSEPHPIAPSGVPDVPDPLELVAAEEVEGSAGSNAVTRIMLIAAVVVIVGMAAYYLMLQTPT